MKPNRQRNLRVVGALIAAMSVMIGLVAYSPTLYRLFCAATGYGGTTQRADGAAASVSDKTVTVRFDTNIAADLPWRFEPVQREVKVRLGEYKLVFFRAENLSDKALVGHATFNVTPDKVGLYFKKIQCFCFDDERLEPHQQVDMPVDFFVDPALAQDPDAQGVSEITLSYTFFRTANSEKAKDLSRFLASAPPDPHRGEELFVQRCTACHALDRNKAGPALGGVFGRRAGSMPGYTYSPALRASGVEWDQDDLDHWLADPRGFVAGAKMPIKIPDATTRRDIIAYLKRESTGETAPPQHSGSDAVAQHASARAPKMAPH